MKKKLGLVFAILLGAAVGVAAGMLVNRHGGGLGDLLLFLLGLYAQIILHEAGHLLAGLISGYRFVSFRVASLMLIRSQGRLRFAHYKLAGTGGQCLMAPPPLDENGNYPCTLYHLGGVLMNALCALIAALFLLRGYSAWWIGILLGGLLLALTNGIPLRMGMVDNDGRNALRSRHEPAVRQGFYDQLMINAALADGQRPREMPSEWFACAPGQEHERGYLYMVWLLDNERWQEAREYAAHLLQCDLPGIHRSIAENELRCLTLLAGETPDAPSKELAQFQRASVNSPIVQRTKYIFALLQDQDEAAAEKARQRFDKILKSYPYPGDVQTDILLMQLARQQYKGGD